jgi:histidine ammonia-lyase
MSAIAARDAFGVVALAEEVAAIHLIALCQALDLRGTDQSSGPVQEAHALIRKQVPSVVDDRAMDADITAVLALIRSGELTEVTAAAG